MQWLAYIGLRFSTGLFALIPFPLLYGVSDILAFVFQYVFRYRSDVVDKNLSFCFPGLPPARQKEYKTAFYRSLSDIMCETFKAISYDAAKLQKRFKVINPELLDQAYEKNESVLMLSQHIGNWEWGAYALSQQLKHNCIAFTKPLSNKYIESYLHEKRAAHGLDINHDLGSAIRKLRDAAPVAFFFLNDQYPGYLKRLCAVPFFNRHIRFNRGPADFAILHNLTVFHIAVTREGRGNYHLHIKPIKATTAEQIIEDYAQKLEDNIITQKESWLWSHKRFKDEGLYQD